MSLKKILILPVGFILIHTLHISCCKCIEGDFHRDISMLRSYDYSHSDLDTKDTVKVIDTLFSSILINYTLITKNKINPFLQLVNAAYATSCNCNNYTDLGFKYKIDSLVVTSDNVFKGIPAGQNISSYFTAVFSRYNNGATTLSYITVPQLIDSINTIKNYDNINLFTNPGVMAAKAHRVKYTLHSNGKSYEGLGTKLVLWQ